MRHDIVGRRKRRATPLAELVSNRRECTQFAVVGTPCNLRRYPQTGAGRARANFNFTAQRPNAKLFLAKWWQTLLLPLLIDPLPSKFVRINTNHFLGTSHCLSIALRVEAQPRREHQFALRQTDLSRGGKEFNLTADIRRNLTGRLRGRGNLSGFEDPHRAFRQNQQPIHNNSLHGNPRVVLPTQSLSVNHGRINAAVELHFPNQSIRGLTTLGSSVPDHPNVRQSTHSLFHETDHIRRQTLPNHMGLDQLQRRRRVLLRQSFQGSLPGLRQDYPL